jgi:hypothetical protein
MRFCRASFRPKAICFFVFLVVSGAVFRFLDGFAIWSTPFYGPYTLVMSSQEGLICQE